MDAEAILCFMTLHVLPASLAIAFDTMFVDKVELPHAINKNIAKWADVFFYTDPEAENIEFKNEPYVFMHQEIIHQLVTTIRHLVLDKNIPAFDVVTAVYTQDNESAAYPLLVQSHENYLKSLDFIINKNGVFTGNEEQKINLENAEIRKKENQNLLQDMILHCDDRIELEDMAKQVDSDVFVNKTLGLMEFAKRRNYKPFGYDKLKP